MPPTTPIRRLCSVLPPLACATLIAIPAAAADPPLPEPDALEGWQVHGEPDVWQASGLYGYINGGAELFLELGFDQLTVARYRSGEAELVVELYRMSDPVAALGAFLAHSGPPDPDSDLDLRHTVGRYELQAHIGRYYVKLQNVSGRRELVPQLLGIARSIGRQIPERAFEDPTRVLPREGLVPGSMRIVRGPLGLDSIYSLGKDDVLSLEPDRTAVAASYRTPGGDRHSLIRVHYPDGEAARKALQHLAGNLDPYLETLERTSRSLLFQGYGGDFGLIERQSQRITILAGLDDRPELAKPSPQ